MIFVRFTFEFPAKIHNIVKKNLPIDITSLKASFFFTKQEEILYGRNVAWEETSHWVFFKFYSKKSHLYSK